MAVIAAAVIAYGIVFWTPWFGARPDYGISKVDAGYADYSYDYSVLADVRELGKRQPEEVQAVATELWDALLKEEEGTLYRLKWVPDVCIEFDCRNVLSSDVKPYIDLVLGYKQSAEKTYRERLTLAISITALLVSMLALFKKKT
jgi:hypothetical protein